MTTAVSRKLVPVDVVTASARSGWAPGIDVRVVADSAAGLFVIGDGYGPAYGGHHFPLALEPCVNAIHAALTQSHSHDVRGGVMAGKRVAEEYAAKYGTAYGYSLIPEPHVTSTALEQARILSRPSVLYHCAVGISLVLLVGNSLYAAQVGMSRIYLRRGADIRLLLLDHSVLSQIVRKYGIHSDEYQRIHEFPPFASTQLLGLSPNVEIDYAIEPLQEFDQVLLCSVGIWNHRQGDEIVRALFEARADAITGITEESTIDAAVVRFRVQSDNIESTSRV